jgi:hypothetical protein
MATPEPSARDPAAQRPSTRHLTVDGRYAAILADELGIKVSTARTAFIGEPKRRASEISGWALDASDDPEERARMILAWAKKHRVGAFREASEEPGLAAKVVWGEVSAEERREAMARERLERLAKALAGMWIENPESLAEAIRALEHSRNGRS